MEHKARPDSSIPTPSVVRFADFELDIRSAELRKKGHRIRLQEQPFQILVEMLKRPGEVVLREEIRKKLWPDDTVVEFDHSINAAIRRLRDALQDSAETPRYIETLARRGYRMIAPLSMSAERAEPGTYPPSAKVWETPANRLGHLHASVAVLAFTNMSADPGNEYFSDGLAEELINKLTHVSGLKVVARTSAFAFKGRQEDIRTIARALGVAHIVEGSVRKAGARVRITAQLIAADDGTHIWSEQYDREIADIFAVQDEISQSIAASLREHLASTPRQHIPPLPAYEAYLKARHCLAAFTRDSLIRGRKFYEDAIAADAAFARAQSGLAMAHVTLVLPGISPARIAMPLARAAAQRALESDPDLQEAYAVLGMVAALYDFDWKEAARQFRHAMACKPPTPNVRWHYSYSYLLPMGHAVQSVEECMRGMEDDPLNFIGGFHYASALLSAGNWTAGEAYLRELSQFHMTHYQPYYLLALSQVLRGLHGEAVQAAEKACSLAPWSTTTRGLLGGILRRSGDANRAGQIYQDLLAGKEYGTAMGLCLFHLGCADTAKAAEWAQRAVEQRDTRVFLVLCLLRRSQPNLLTLDRGWSSISRTIGIP